MIVVDISGWEWLEHFHLSRNLMSLNGVAKVGGGFDIPLYAIQSAAGYTKVWD